MAEASQVVKEMAAEARQGRTPAMLEHFLRAHLGKPHGGQLSEPESYEVREVSPFKDGGFFRRSCVFWVFARGQLLEGSVLPAGGTFGLFSLGTGGLRYLHRRHDNVEALLQDEARPLDECAPAALASLVSEALGRDRNNSHAVLESAEHLARFGGGYEVDAREWERVRSSVAAPAISGGAGAGWRLEFCSVFGWMHEKRSLVHHRCRFAPDYRILLEQDVLSPAIFSRVPAIQY